MSCIIFLCVYNCKQSDGWKICYYILKFNIVRINTKHSHKQITKLCNYKIIILSSLTVYNEHLRKQKLCVLPRDY